MCEPTTIAAATLAVSVASAGAGMYQQQQQAEAQADYQKQRAQAKQNQIEQNSKNAREAYIEKTAAQNQRLVEEEAASTAELQDLREQKLQRQGTAVASSNAAGVSLDRMLADFERQEAVFRDRSQENLTQTQLQAERNQESFRATAINQAQSVRPFIPKPIQSPDYAGAGAQVLNGGIRAADRYQTYKNNQEG